MTIAQLQPDVALAALLDGKIELDYGAKGGLQRLPCYADGAQPEKNPPQCFLSVGWNGGAEAVSDPPGIYRGNLLLQVCCRLLNLSATGQTVNRQRVARVLAQVEPLVHRRRSGAFVFGFSPGALVMPTTPNLTTGYSTTILNVRWHN